MLFAALLSACVALSSAVSLPDLRPDIVRRHPYAGDFELSRHLLSTNQALKGPNAMSSWAKLAYALPHEMVRRELAVVQRAAKKLDLNSFPWHLPAFFSYWRFVLPVIHGHHWSEEHVLFPAIISRTGGSLPPQMTADHVTLLRSLEHITSLEGRLQAMANKTEATMELRREVDKLVELMVPHLNEEEDELVPLIAKHFSKQSMDAVVDEIVGKLNPVLLLWEFAAGASWFDFWCTEETGCDLEEKERLLAKLPLPMRILLLQVAVPRIMDALTTLKSIETGHYVPYSKWPRWRELVLLGLVLAFLSLLLFITFRVLSIPYRAIFGRPQPPKAKLQ